MVSKATFCAYPSMTNYTNASTDVFIYGAVFLSMRQHETGRLSTVLQSVAKVATAVTTNSSLIVPVRRLILMPHRDINQVPDNFSKILLSTISAIFGQSKIRSTHTCLCFSLSETTLASLVSFFV